MAEWTRVVNTTLTNYLKKREVNTLRNRKLTALLEKDGRVSFGWSGKEVEWRVQYRELEMGTGYADMGPVSFARTDVLQLARLPWRGYIFGEAVSKKEKLMNKGKEAIVNLLSETPKIMMSSMDNQFAEEFYVDGNAAGNTLKIHGIESFLGTTGSVAADNKTIPPSDTFADLSTILGNYGGTWTGSWPDGVGDPEYDFWSPLICYSLGTGWADGALWSLNALEILRFAIIALQRNKSKEGMMNLVMLPGGMYREFLNLMSIKERVEISRGEKSSALISMGFSGVTNFDGVDVTWEYGLPDANTGYFFNTNHMELRSLNDRLFVLEGPFWDETTQTMRFTMEFFGNATYNPRYFGCVQNVLTS